MSIMKLSLIIIATALILLTATFYFESAPHSFSPKPVPFDYNLTVAVPESNVRQGAEMHTYLTATYIQGNPENVTFNITGLPDDASFELTTLQGLLANNTVLNSNLTIHVPTNVPLGNYTVLVSSAAANGATHNFAFNLTVTDNIVVSGVITTNSWINVTGVVFEMQKPDYTGGEKYYGTVLSSSEFTVYVPNNHFYYVGYTYTTALSSGTRWFILPISIFAASDKTEITGEQFSMMWNDDNPF
ncbi:MAG: hypothetical protein NWE93_04150 [Candidatus Bathyarchaeota archaeon]|nr:hypothetical protein [Candidatus Bathyarchaeota archaeon]